MLVDVGVNNLREHIVPEARIHSVVTSGGQAPNAYCSASLCLGLVFRARSRLEASLMRFVAVC